MATYTTNLNLKKPAQSDKIRIADINNNMDTLDGAIGDIGERSVAAQLGDVEGALAIVSTGNVHVAITSGQYVYIKNHDTLDDGLYVATTNISANGTLSSSNVTADSAGGGLNALNGKITALEKHGSSGAVDLTGYTSSSNKYTCPCDGYVVLTSRQVTSGKLNVNIELSAGQTIYEYMNITSAWQLHSVFVKKGMKVYIDSLPANTGLTFSPLDL